MWSEEVCSGYPSLYSESDSDVPWERTGPAAAPALSFMASSRILSKNVKSGLSKTFITKDEDYKIIP